MGTLGSLTLIVIGIGLGFIFTKGYWLEKRIKANREEAKRKKTQEDEKK